MHGYRGQQGIGRNSLYRSIEEIGMSIQYVCLHSRSHEMYYECAVVKI